MGEFWIAKNNEQLDYFCEHIKRVWDFNRPLRIEWKEGSARSNAQNNYLHALFADIALAGCKRNGIEFDRDHHPKEVKDFFKERFGKKEDKFSLIDKAEVATLVSTAKYTKGEMHDFIEKIQAWCAHAGITVNFEKYKDML